ncbi:porin [Inhella gelatinilytica]|uniref:Porin n=1 Tax=Inhella gelatinilytica TaxID=2795030 RepID=A0A931IXF4_9BURK|nr:porin [Inhella gelatinilytica]MBH9552418.1 porin [Inhella gelatinilytica]
MKKNILTLAALGLFSGLVAAQSSSVTLFGNIDVSVRNIKGAGSATLVLDEGRAASRIGLRGVEDLGGGMKASFHLESGLNPDDGTSGSPFWGRRATVSLSGGFGEVRLGRHKWADRLIVDEFDPMATSGAANVTRIFSGLGSATGVINRADNQVGYVLPLSGGFYGGFDYAFDESTAPGNKGAVGRIGYKSGGLHIAGAFGEHGVGTKLKSSTVGAAYAVGDLSLTGFFTKNKYGTADQRIFGIGGAVKMGSGRFVVSIANASGSGTDKDAKLLGMGYDYSLSKRTTLYTTLARINNDGTAKFSVQGTRSSGVEAPAAGGTSRSFDVGVRHSF